MDCISRLCRVVLHNIPIGLSESEVHTQIQLYGSPLAIHIYPAREMHKNAKATWALIQFETVNEAAEFVEMVNSLTKPSMFMEAELLNKWDESRHRWMANSSCYGRDFVLEACSDLDKVITNKRAVVKGLKVVACVGCGMNGNLCCSRCQDRFCTQECFYRNWLRHKATCFPVPALVPAEETVDVSVMQHRSSVPERVMVGSSNVIPQQFSMLADSSKVNLASPDFFKGFSEMQISQIKKLTENIEQQTEFRPHVDVNPSAANAMNNMVNYTASIVKLAEMEENAVPKEFFTGVEKVEGRQNVQNGGNSPQQNARPHQRANDANSIQETSKLHQYANDANTTQQNARLHQNNNSPQQNARPHQYANDANSTHQNARSHQHANDANSTHQNARPHQHANDANSTHQNARPRQYANEYSDGVNRGANASNNGRGGNDSHYERKNANGIQRGVGYLRGRNLQYDNVRHGAGNQQGGSGYHTGNGYRSDSNNYRGEREASGNSQQERREDQHKKGNSYSRGGNSNNGAYREVPNRRVNDQHPALLNTPKPPELHTNQTDFKPIVEPVVEKTSPKQVDNKGSQNIQNASPKGQENDNSVAKVQEDIGKHYSVNDLKILPLGTPGMDIQGLLLWWLGDDTVVVCNAENNPGPKLQNLVVKHTSTSKPINFIPLSSELVLAPFEGEYYRAALIEDAEDGIDAVSVLFIDFGNVETVKLSTMYPMSADIFNIPSGTCNACIPAVRGPDGKADPNLVKIAKQVLKLNVMYDCVVTAVTDAGYELEFPVLNDAIGKSS